MEKLTSFAQTRVGASHLSRDIVCQDSSLCEDHESYSFAAAADGHGSPCYLRTERGSKFAVECAAECVAEFLDSLEDAAEVLADERQRQQLFNQLWRSIIARWHDKTEKDFTDEPFTEEELDRIPDKFAHYRERYAQGDYISAYGTTLLFAAVTDDYAFGAQIGDGKCVVIDGDSNVTAPIPEDPRCYENVTTSMCQDDAALSARFFYLNKGMLPAVENGMEEGVRQLGEFLPAMTKKGSGDDVTCSGIIAMSKLSSCSDGIREDLAAAAPVVEEPVPENIVYDDEASQQVVTDVMPVEPDTPVEATDEPGSGEQP